MEEIFKVIDKEGQIVIRIQITHEDSRIRKSKAHEALRQIYPRGYSQFKIIRLINPLLK